jgi:hypothetical protein
MAVWKYALILAGLRVTTHLSPDGQWLKGEL